MWRASLARFSTSCATRSTNLWKRNTAKASSRMWSRKSRESHAYETRCPVRHFLWRDAGALDTAGQAEDMAALFISDPVGRRRSVVRRVQGPDVLDRDSRQHGARPDWLQHLGGAGHDSWP